MIKVTRINKEFDIYKKRKLIIWGCGLFGKKILDVFINLNIDVFAFCDNNQKLWGTKKYDIQIISPKDLESMISKGITVQMGLVNNYEKEVLKQIYDWENVEVISYQEAWQVLGYAQKLIYLENNNNITISTYQEDLIYKNQVVIANLKKYMYENSNANYYLILCLPPKTGDWTLHKTFKYNDIKNSNIVHMPHVIGDKRVVLYNVGKTVKVITAVREPVGQSISALYQMISKAYESSLTYDNSLNNICNNLDTWCKDGGDVQNMFNNMINTHMSYIKSPNGTYEYLPQNVEILIQNFNHCILDITKYPFDKDLGYSTIKHKNLEVFVYQLEKMNTIVDALSEFLGRKIDKLHLDNVASDKWVAESYDTAKKELKITQEQMDFFYNQSYVKHFYSEEDIEKFKARWKNNLV